MEGQSFTETHPPAGLEAIASGKQENLRQEKLTGGKIQKVRQKPWSDGGGSNKNGRKSKENGRGKQKGNAELCVCGS